MRPDIEARIERAVDAAFEARVPNCYVQAVYGEGLEWAWPCQTALEELIRDEVPRDLVKVFAYRLSWHNVAFRIPYEQEEDRDRWIDCSGIHIGVDWPQTISREPSFAPHSWPGIAPAQLRQAANDVEQLLQAGLLDPIPANRRGEGLEGYQMPWWLWAAYLEVIQRIAERNARSREREDAPAAQPL